MIHSKAWMLGLLLILSIICAAALESVTILTGPIIRRNEEQKQMITVLAVLGVPFEKKDPESVPRTYREKITEGTEHGLTVFREKETGRAALLMSGSGFQSLITVVAALDGETMSGFQVVSQNETPGLGSRIAEDTFMKQFIGKKVSGGISYVKTGNAGPSEFDAVTGATESSKALARILNSGFKAFFNIKTAVIVPKNLDAKYMSALLEVFGIPFNAQDSLAVKKTFDMRVTQTEKNGRTVYLDKDGGASALILGGGGYQSVIMIAVALKGDTVSGFRIISQNETPGIGSRIKEDGFQKQFVGKKVSGGIKPVKTGKAGPAEFDAITKATVSSEAVAVILNDGFSVYYNVKIEKIEPAAAKVADAGETAVDAAVQAPATARRDSLAVAKAEEKPVVKIAEKSDAASPDGEKNGIVMTLSGMGYADTITVTVEFSKETIRKFKVVKQSETPGMGDQIEKEEFLRQFIGKDISKGITLVKTGKAGPAEFDAITGATVSSEAIAKILNAGIQAYHKSK